MRSPLAAPRAGNATAHIQAHRVGVPFDLETTGLDTSGERIVQWGGVRRAPDGSCKERLILINPGRPIPPKATEVHKITDAMVAGLPKFAAHAAEIWGFMCKDTEYWLGHNICRYDVPLLRAEMARAGYELPDTLQVDTLRMFNHADNGKPRLSPKHDLGTAYRFFTGEDFADAHDAMEDTRASMVVADGLIASFPDKFGDFTPETLAKV